MNYPTFGGETDVKICHIFQNKKLFLKIVLLFETMVNISNYIFNLPVLSKITDISVSKVTPAFHY